MSNSAERRKPNSGISSAPNVDAPTSDTQIGSFVTARISSIFCGHSSMVQLFQSSGNPCRATTSITLNTPVASMLLMKPASIGEIQPSTCVRELFSDLTAEDASFTIVANIFQSGSTSKSQ